MGIPEDQQETPGMAALLHETARAYFFNSQPEEALLLCRKALSMAEKLGLAEVQAETLATMGILTIEDMDVREQYLRQAAQLADEANLPASSARAHFNLGTHLARKMEVKDALAHKLKAIEMARRMGIAAWEHSFLGEAADYLMTLGDFQAVEKALEDLKEIRRRFSIAKSAIFYVNLIEASYLEQQGRLDEALALLQQSIGDDHDGSLTTKARKNTIRFGIGNLLFQMGRFEEAAQVLSQSIDNEVPDPYDAQFTARTILSVIRLQLGDKEESHKLIQEAREIARARNPSVREEAILLLTEARLAVIENRWKDAFDAYESITRSFKGWGFKWRHAYTLMEWAVALHKRKKEEDFSRSVELLSEAISVFKEINIPIYQEKCEDLLQKAQKRIYRH
jgi:tetratricopeptide (TPR) repeat protein